MPWRQVLCFGFTKKQLKLKGFSVYFVLGMFFFVNALRVREPQQGMVSEKKTCFIFEI